MARLSWGAVATVGGQGFDPGGFGFTPTGLATTETTTLGIVEEDYMWEVRRQKAWWPNPWQPDDIIGSVNLFIGSSNGAGGEVRKIDVLYTFDATPGVSYDLQAFIDAIRIKRIDPDNLIWTQTGSGTADPDGIMAAVPMDGTPPAWWTHTPTDLVLETQTSGIDNRYGCYAACVFDPQNGCMFENSMRLTQRKEASWRDPDTGLIGHYGVGTFGIASVTFNGALRGRMNSADLSSNGQSPPIRWSDISSGGSQIGIQGELSWPPAVALPTDAEVSMKWYDVAFSPAYSYRYAVYVYDDANQMPTVLVSSALPALSPIFYLTRQMVDISSYVPSGGCTRVYAYVMLQVDNGGGGGFVDVPANAPPLPPLNIYNIVNPTKAPIATPGWTCGGWSWIPGLLGPPLAL